MTDPLRSGIAELLRRGTPSNTPRRGRIADASFPVNGVEAEVESPVDGAEVRTVDGRTVCIIRRELEDLLPGASLRRTLMQGLKSLAERDPASIYPGLRPAVGRDLADLVVLDLETTGFWGCPVFLAGLLFEEEGRLVSVQVLARDYPEEPAMLAVASSLLGERKLLVTFNGKSYDVPCFRERCDYHRIRTSVQGMYHVDVLHAARRRWKDELPDCRLQTLEWEVVGLHRTGDVPSAEIPAVYHAFAASGDPRELNGVLHHSRVDVVTTASLLARLLEDPPEPRHKRRKKRTE